MRALRCRFLAGPGLALVMLAPAAAMAQIARNGPWRITHLAGQPLAENASARTSFALDAQTGRMAATVGCNRIGGAYQVKGGALSFGQVMMTRMACPGELDTRERAFTQALEKTQRWRIENGVLLLLDGNGAALVRMRSARRQKTRTDDRPGG